MTDAYRFITAEKANYPISLMSRVLGVSRTAYHRWEGRAPSQRELQDAFLAERIREIHRAARSVYGAPRIHTELRMADGDRGLAQAGGAIDAGGRDQRLGAQRSAVARRSACRG